MVKCRYHSVELPKLDITIDGQALSQFDDLAMNPHFVRTFNIDRKDTYGGSASSGETNETVWIYVETDKEVGDRDHLKVFATGGAAEKWFDDNDPTGVAFEYEVNPSISPDFRN